MLLTDYSSMCFEFFLQNKPVIFYKTDDSADCSAYGRWEDEIKVFDGKENELFNIAETPDEITAIISKYIENNFECEKEISDKEAAFFYYKDNFCKRFETFMLENIDKPKTEL